VSTIVPTDVLGVTTVPNRPPPAEVQGVQEVAESAAPSGSSRQVVSTYGATKSLAFTGARSELVVLLACALLLAGMALVGATLQRRGRVD
jgi:hypothetical protein